MKFLCLIHLNEEELDAMPAEDMNSLVDGIARDA
jgi:hypothetical protein